MITEAYTAAKQLLEKRLDDLAAGAKLLLEKETITPTDFPPIGRSGGLPPLRAVGGSER
jgi:cell division protease FtsH